MALTANEHYAGAVASLVGGGINFGLHLWLLTSFFPKTRMRSSLKSLHTQVALANLLVAVFFFVGAITHYQQDWIFGDLFCKFYVFWCKFSPILATGLLTACLYAEYQHATDPSLAKKDEPFTVSSLLAWINALVWGVLALTWSRYGQDPAGFICTVNWYEVQPYVTFMSTFGFGLPVAIAGVYALSLWSKGLLINNPSATAAAGLFITMNLQFGAYASGYAVVCCGYTLSIYAIAFAQIWTKSMGILHPLVYRSVFANSASGKKA